MTNDQGAATFANVAEYEAAHPEYAAAEKHLSLTMEQYQATLSALYRPTIITSNSAESPVNASLE